MYASSTAYPLLEPNTYQTHSYIDLFSAQKWEANTPNRSAISRSFHC